MNVAKWTPIPQRVNWEVSLGFADVYITWESFSNQPKAVGGGINRQPQKLAFGLPAS